MMSSQNIAFGSFRAAAMAWSLVSRLSFWSGWRMNAVRIPVKLSARNMTEQQLHKPVVVDVSGASAAGGAVDATGVPPRLELPHTRGCFVCDRDNPRGLHLSSFVDPATGRVTIDFAPRREHAGFEGLVHGGITATVVDEAMVWAATWRARKFCV